MKSTISKVISIMIIVGVIIGCLCAAVLMPTEHEFGVNACYCMFGCTIEEFFDQEFEFYEETGDFRETARINRDGELLIKLTDKQEKIWIESEWFDIIHNVGGRNDIKVSQDLKVITVYTSKDMEEETMDKMIDVINSILIRMHFINSVSGKKKSHITIIDKSIETGEEIDRQDISFGYLFE